MSGKVSSVVLAMAAVLCALTVAVQTHEFTKEQCLEFTKKMANASCEVKYNKTEAEIVYANCIQSKTEKEVPEDKRADPEFYCGLELTGDQWKEVEKCAHEKTHFQEKWTQAQAQDFAINNMTYTTKDAEESFSKGIDECFTQFGSNATEVTQCGKKLYFEVCLGITFNKPLPVDN